MAINYLHSKKKCVNIKKMLHTRLSGSQPGRPLTRIHSSAVTYAEKPFCAREHSLYSIIPDVQPASEFISTALNITFEFGRFIQDKINNEWLVDVMVGDWECSRCHTTHEACKRPKVLCAKCGGKDWRYKEINILSDHCGISGGLDALIDDGTGKFTILEIKTLDKDQFKELTAPKAEHRERTNLYMELVKQSSQPIAKFIDTKQANILYVSKSFGFKDMEIKEYGIGDSFISPFKEFRILSEPAKVQHLIALGKSVKDFREGKKAIPKKICSTILDKRAKACCCPTQCFSGDYPDNKFMRDI